MLRYSFLLFLLLFLTACGGSGLSTSGDGPTIIELSASPNSIRAGESATLSWRAAGATSYTVEPDIGAVDGTSVTVSPAQTTLYTLTALNGQSRNSAEIEVFVIGGGSGNDTTAPSGSFGVSSASSGPFSNDKLERITDADDVRVVRVTPGETFYAQVSYTDPSGVTAIELNLVNSSPAEVAGPLEPTQQFFTKGESLGNCDLSSSATSVTCIYPIRVDADAVNIDELTSREFAYVFRTKVTDSAGNQSDEAIRGYVIVDENAESAGPNPEPNPSPTPKPTPDPKPTPQPTPQPAPQPTPDPSENQTARVTIEEVDSVARRTWLNLEATTSGFDADKVQYRWRLVKGNGRVWTTNMRTEDTQVMFSRAGEYRLELQVSDGAREAKATVNILVRER